MRRVLTFLLILITLAACTREGLFPDDGCDMVRIGVELENVPAETKASNGTIDDSKINSTVLIIFKNQQDRVLYQKSQDRAYPLLEVPGNCQLNIFAIVNPSNDFASVTTYSAFKKMSSKYNYSNTQNFEMVARLDTVLRSDCNVVLNIRRISSKLTISSIKYKQMPCDNVSSHFLESIHLYDMAGSCPYTMDNFVPSNFVNGSYSDRLSGVEISGYTPIRSYEGGKEYYEFEAGYTFYCYPNTSETHTKLVLELSGWGRTNDICMHYYSFELPDMLPNRNYVINRLLINRAGYDEYPGDYCHPLSFNVDYDMDVYDASSGILETNYQGREVCYAEFDY